MLVVCSVEPQPPAPRVGATCVRFTLSLSQDLLFPLHMRISSKAIEHCITLQNDRSGFSTCCPPACRSSPNGAVKSASVAVGISCFEDSQSAAARPWPLGLSPGFWAGSSSWSSTDCQTTTCSSPLIPLLSLLSDVCSCLFFSFSALFLDPSLAPAAESSPFTGRMKLPSPFLFSL